MVRINPPIVCALKRPKVLVGIDHRDYIALLCHQSTTQVKFDVADAFILHHDFKIAGIEFPATLRVALFFQCREQSLRVQLFSLPRKY